MVSTIALFGVPFWNSQPMRRTWHPLALGLGPTRPSASSAAPSSSQRGCAASGPRRLRRLRRLRWCGATTGRPGRRGWGGVPSPDLAKGFHWRNFQRPKLPGRGRQESVHHIEIYFPLLQWHAQSGLLMVLQSLSVPAPLAIFQLWKRSDGQVLETSRKTMNSMLAILKWGNI